MSSHLPSYAETPRPHAAFNPHVVANAALMGGLGAVFALAIVSTLISATLIDPVFTPPGPSDAEQGQWWGRLIANLWVGVGSLVGLAWGATNCYGLIRRRHWARRSGIAFWAFSLLCCGCLPFSVYGLWSLTRKEVLDALRAPKP